MFVNKRTEETKRETKKVFQEEHEEHDKEDKEDSNKEQHAADIDDQEQVIKETTASVDDANAKKTEPPVSGLLTPTQEAQKESQENVVVSEKG